MENIAFIDNIIHDVLAHEAEQPELYKLVTTCRSTRPEVFCKNALLQISQNSQQNLRARVFFLIKLQISSQQLY